MNSIIEKIKQDEILNKIMQTDYNILLVGGCIRDFYLGRENFDKDIIVLDAEARKVAIELADMFGAAFVPLDEQNKIYRVVLIDKKGVIDITNPIENDLEKDLGRRDFTMNSVAVSLKTFKLYDLFNGLEDLKKGLIRVINEKNLIDDPLRLLRAYRFQAVLGFEIDKKTEELLGKHFKLINNPAKERISYELMKMFSGKNTYKALENMDKSNILTEILPIFNDVKQVPPNTHHHLTLFYHSLAVLNFIQEFYDNSSPEIKEHLERDDFGGFSRLAHLKLAGFLHDIGKYSTWTIESDTGRHRFFKHEDVGAKMSRSILKSLKFSKKQIDYISDMIKNHLYPSQVISEPNANEKAYMRYIRKMGNSVIDNIYLAKSDRLSARGMAVTEEVVARNLNGLTELMNFYLSVRDSLKPLPKLLSGEDIMNLLEIKPSKELGRIMDLLHEAQLNGEVNTKEEAVLFVVKTV